MRYIYVLLMVLILSSACNAQSSPNTPPPATLPATPNTPTVVQPAAQQPTTAPTTTQPINMSSDEVIRIARAEMERDAYKQAWQECQKSFDNIKWVVQVALTAIGLILALFGLIIFKNTKEFKEAVADARKACEKAEEWEEKARATCNKIDDLVKEKLAEIEKKNEEQVKNATEKIDALVKTKLEESTKKIDDKSEKERQISELWNTALRLGNEGKYEEACEKYAEIVKLRPEDFWAYSNWGAALANWAKVKGDEKLFKQACEKFEQAFRIGPEDYLLHVNWGATLGLWAQLKSDEKLFEQAFQKYEKAIKINPNEPKAYNSWGGTLLYWIRLKYGTPEYEDFLNQAEEKGLKAESLRKGSSAYNLACIYALRGNREECKKWLLNGQEAGTLPEREYAMKDNDFDSVKNEAWFKEIKWKGER